MKKFILIKFHMLQSLLLILQANRDLLSNEMQQMRQQLKYLQAELCSRGGAPTDELRVFIITEICIWIIMRWNEFLCVAWCSTGS